MAESPAVPLGLKLNDLAKFNCGVGVILLALKDAGKDPRSLTYPDIYQAVQQSLAPRLERYSIPEPQRIVSELLDYLRSYQSVFTLSAH